MEPVIVGWIMIGMVMVFLLAGLPVAFAMFTAGAIGHLLLVGFGHTVASIPIIFYDKMSTYSFSVIPLFILMGFFAAEAGFADDAFKAATRWVGGLTGGLAQAVIAAGAAFGAACGTTIAACATLAKITIPPLRHAGVSEKLAIGAVAAAAPLSVMIPPSVVFPIYGIITEQSIGKLLMAGLIPGIVAAIILMTQVFLMVKFRPALAPKSPSFSWSERFSALKGIWGIAVVFLAVLGFIYTGIITPTEAGAVGASAALLVGLASRRLKWKTGIVGSFFETAKSTSTILIICVCALYFSHGLLISRLPDSLSQLLVGLQVHRLVILIGILVLDVFLGCIIDTLSILLLTMPIVFPAIVKLGYDPIWFGVLMVQISEIGALTPPFGLNLFVLRGSLPGVPMNTIISATGPFIAVYVFTLALLVAFPQLSLWLPGMMWGS